MVVVKLVNVQLQWQLVLIQIWLISSKYMRIKTNKKRLGGKFVLNLNFCVEALNISGQSNTQEKKVLSVFN